MDLSEAAMDRAEKYAEDAIDSLSADIADNLRAPQGEIWERLAEVRFPDIRALCLTLWRQRAA